MTALNMLSSSNALVGKASGLVLLVLFSVASEIQAEGADAPTVGEGQKVQIIGTSKDAIPGALVWPASGDSLFLT